MNGNAAAFRADAEESILTCAAMLREIRQMRAEVESWPLSEQKIALRLRAQLEHLDERIRRVLNELVSTSEH